MIKLKKIIKEMAEHELAEYDDWQNYFFHNDYDLSKDVLQAVQHKFKLTAQAFFQNQILKFKDDHDNVVWLSLNSDGDTYDVIRDIVDFITNKVGNLDIDVGTIYNDHIGCTLNDFCQDPGFVYHYTKPVKWAEIQAAGFMRGSSGTGINNRPAHGIFTNIDPEEYQDGVYGAVCLQLDLKTFQRDNGLNKLNIEYEPEVAEWLLAEYVDHMLGVDSLPYLSSDISPKTLIIGHHLPVKYIRVFNPEF
jgi:hypothetical protein